MAPEAPTAGVLNAVNILSIVLLGALIGFIMMWYWKKDQFNNKRWD